MPTDTLIIKHLSHTFTNKEKEEFLKNFGAGEVTCISSQKNKYNVVFAKFPSPAVAEDVLHRLHQVEILGQYLSVEYARGKHSQLSNQDEIVLEEVEEPDSKEKSYQNFINKLNSWHSTVNFKQPVPSHLKYEYPPPTGQVLLNIARVLATVPKFYTQVLHLMNKMNLPCPFEIDLLPHVDLGFHREKHFYESGAEEKGLLVESDKQMHEDVEDLDTDLESEMSTDEETTKKEIIPVTKAKLKKKTIKKPKFIKPISVVQKRSKTKYEDVFEKLEDEEPVKKLTPLPKHTTEELSRFTAGDTGFGFIEAVQKEVVEKEVFGPVRDEREEERLEKEVIECISIEELEANKIPATDLSSLPVFKNYAPGAQSSRLYIKNLSRTVTEADLKFIYSRYITESSMLDIRLMTEGRMKGQAFINLPTPQIAQKALNETNGFILKDKPLVVQFGRSNVK